MLNPIEGNVFCSGGATFTIAENFSEITIERDGQKVVVPPSALKNLLIVMDAELMANKDGPLFSERLWHFIPTTASCPKAEL